MTKDDDRRPGNDTFEMAWRRRFEEFASIRDDDAGIAGWSPAGLDARMRRFTELWRAGRPGARWLDAGCGAGTYTRYLFDRGADVKGVDYSLPAIRKARTRSPLGIGYAVADVRRLPFRADTFDGVLCFGVIQALAESESALGELCLLTRPGGELWVDALNPAFVVNAARVLARRLRRRPAHLRYESSRVLRRFLVAQGFRDVTIFWMPIAPRRLPWLQQLLETRILRKMLQAVPLLGAVISHSFIVRGMKPRRPWTRLRAHRNESSVGNILYRALASAMSPGGRRARLSILIYHRVLAHKDGIATWDLTADAFERHMRVVMDNFVPLPLLEALGRLAAGDLPPRAVCITFDDGYLDNFEVALPILKRYELSATFFVATGYLDGGYMWNDKVIEALRAIPGPVLDLNAWGLPRFDLGSDQARRLAIIGILPALKHLPSQEREARAEQLAVAASLPAGRGP